MPFLASIGCAAAMAAGSGTSIEAGWSHAIERAGGGVEFVAAFRGDHSLDQRVDRRIGEQLGEMAWGEWGDDIYTISGDTFSAIKEKLGIGADVTAVLADDEVLPAPVDF